MSKDPAILFYTSDFLTGTMFFSDDQVGKYIRLLCAQHQKGRLNKKDMLNICKTYDKDIFDKFKVDKNGLYYNIRLENEAIRRRKYSESRSKNRKNKAILKKISLSYEKHMETETETETENINETETEIHPTFQDFWDCYNKKIGSKSNVEKKWNKLSQNTKELIMNYIFDYVKATPEKQYRANPETFLNQKRWENEIINQNGEKGKSTDQKVRTEYFRRNYPGYEKL